MLCDLTLMAAKSSNLVADCIDVNASPAAGQCPSQFLLLPLYRFNNILVILHFFAAQQCMLAGMASPMPS